MTQEEKELLLKDLSARLPYGVKIELTWWVMDEGTCINTTLEPDHIEQLLNDEYGDTEIKPYLRPMSSMTKEEEDEFVSFTDTMFRFGEDDSLCVLPLDTISWLNKKMFDYRGLIEKGLAIKVTKENNPYKLD